MKLNQSTEKDTYKPNEDYVSSSLRKNHGTAIRMFNPDSSNVQSQRANQVNQGNLTAMISQHNRLEIQIKRAKENYIRDLKDKENAQSNQMNNIPTSEHENQLRSKSSETVSEQELKHVSFQSDQEIVGDLATGNSSNFVDVNPFVHVDHQDETTKVLNQTASFTQHENEDQQDSSVDQQNAPFESSPKTASSFDKDSTASRNIKISDEAMKGLDLQFWVPSKTNIQLQAPSHTTYQHNFVDQLFCGAWRERIHTLVNLQGGLPKNDFEKNSLRMVRKNYYACCCCLKFISPDNVLRHFSTHFEKRHIGSSYHYKLPNYTNGSQCWKHRNCFIKGCKEEFFSTNDTNSFAQQLRVHLHGAHSQSELKQYGYHTELLRSDIKLSKGIEQEDDREIFMFHKDEVLYRRTLADLNSEHKNVFKLMNDYLMKPKWQIEKEKQEHNDHCQDIDAASTTAVQALADPKTQEVVAHQSFTNSASKITQQEKTSTMNQDLIENSVDRVINSHFKSSFDQRQSKFVSVSNKSQEKFDVNKAFESVKNSRTDGSHVFKPFVFTQMNNSFVDTDYLSDKIEIKEDENGIKWLKLLDWMVLKFDFSMFTNTYIEYEIQRSLIVAEQFGGQEGYEGIAKIKDHGWKDQSSLVYCVVIEQTNEDFDFYREEEDKGCELQQTTKLLVARSMLTVVNTMLKLCKLQGLIITSISPNDFRIRSDLQSGFLQNLDVVQENTTATTTGFPWYAQSSPIFVKLSDSLIAVLNCFVKYIALKAFEIVLDKQIKLDKSKQVTPFNFFGRVLHEKSLWNHSDKDLRNEMFETIYKKGQVYLDTDDGQQTLIYLLARTSASSQIHCGQEFKDKYPDSENLRAMVSRGISQEDNEDWEEEQIEKPAMKKGKPTKAALTKPINKTSKCNKNKKPALQARKASRKTRSESQDIVEIQT